MGALYSCSRKLADLCRSYTVDKEDVAAELTKLKRRLRENRIQIADAYGTYTEQCSDPRDRRRFIAPLERHCRTRATLEQGIRVLEDRLMDQDDHDTTKHLVRSTRIANALSDRQARSMGSTMGSLQHVARQTERNTEMRLQMGDRVGMAMEAFAAATTDGIGAFASAMGDSTTDSDGADRVGLDADEKRAADQTLANVERILHVHSEPAAGVRDGRQGAVSDREVDEFLLRVDNFLHTGDPVFEADNVAEADDGARMNEDDSADRHLSVGPRGSSGSTAPGGGGAGGSRFL